MIFRGEQHSLKGDLIQTKWVSLTEWAAVCADAFKTRIGYLKDRYIVI